MTILQYHSKDEVESLTKRKEHYNNSSTLVAWSSSTGIVMIHQLFHAPKILAIFNDTLGGNYFLFDSRYYCRDNLNECRVEEGTKTWMSNCIQEKGFMMANYKLGELSAPCRDFMFSIGGAI